MSTFFFNSSSNESIISQWTRHLQTKSYIGDIREVITQNRKELQSTLHSASAEQLKAMQQVCGTLDAGFSEVSQYLQDINCNISELRGEMNAMAAMLDWKLSMMIEEQKVTNVLLGHIAQLLRIPDSQKQRAYYIEQGLKYFKNAILEDIGSSFYADALEGFKKAELIEQKDYITLNYIGQIYLYSKEYMDIPIAEQYFLKSAREASAEANAGGTTTSNYFSPETPHSIVYDESPFKAAAAEAYLYAGRACYLQHKLQAATEYTAKAYGLVSEFLQARFEHSKYLAANGHDSEAAALLETVINKDRLFSVKTLLDGDLASKKLIIDLLGNLQTQAVSKAKQIYDKCVSMMSDESKARDVVAEAQLHISKNSFLSAMKAIDLLTDTYQFPYIEYSLSILTINETTLTPSLTLIEFLTRENASAERLKELRSEVEELTRRAKEYGEELGRKADELRRKKENLTRRKRDEYIIVTAICGGISGAAIGLFVGFFRGCTLSTMSEDTGTWVGTIIFFALAAALIGLGVGVINAPKGGS